MKELRKISRALFSAAIRHTGVLGLWRFLHRRQVLILVLHGTSSPARESSWKPLREQITIAQLERALRLLSGSYQFVSLDEAVDMITGVKPVKDNSVAVTFDDGYRSNIKYALPVLKRFGIRPTIFVSTAYVDGQVPHWFDRLDYAMQVAAMNGRAVQVGGRTIKLMSSDRAQLAESYAELRRAAKSVKRDDREMLNELNAIATEFESGNGAPHLRDDDWSAVLTWDEIRSAKDSVDFGSHSVDHVRVGAVPIDVASAQLELSKKRIEAETGEACRYFAYPDGHYNETVMKMSAEVGYKAALTMDAGLNEVGEHPMAMKRISVPLGGTDSELLAELSGFLKWMLG